MTAKEDVMMETRVEHPGPALVVKVVEAARQVKRWSPPGGADGWAEVLANALESLDLALQDEADEAGQVNAGHWHPATWADVETGDRVRIGQAEATVEVALPLDWKGSRAAQIQVKLEGRPQPYTMPPSGPVERWVAALPDWAADAFRILADAGLGAEVISHG